MWIGAAAPPIVMQYTVLGEMQHELQKIVNGAGWIEIRSGRGKPDFEEYIKASAVIRYVMEVW
jgi:hypothetical protein